ncbi:MAG: dephospho-CoA kinase [Bacteroidales bacterium]|nr:dephospho-CoA kinase [Bacteroidales bacterium]
MFKIGITGSIGSGKTTVCTMFEILGINVYHADTEAKKFFSKEPVKKKIKYLFGNSIFDKNGNIDNKILASIVFNNPHSLEKLNSLIHPLVKSDFDSWLKKYKKKKYILHEAAIIFESGFYKDFDAIITVSAPKDLRIKRVKQRDNTTEQEILKRMKFQLSDEDKVKKADFIIYNDEQQLLIPQILKIHNELTGKSKL